RTVWFQLVDEGTRDAFARTSVDELLLPEGAIMAQFQNRVFGKIARALPPDWGSFILRVYPDRETYDEEGGQPLDPYSLLDGLGELKELIVEVPPRDIDIMEMELKYLFLETLEWREPRRFCESAGRDWIYQGEQELTAVLSRELVKNYEAWNQCRGDNQKVFLVGSGPGTGKSRMLDEMKNLVCQSAKLSENEALIDRMKDIYVFNVTFENDTAATGSLVKRDVPEFDISYRMLYQLVKEGKKTPWATFVRKVKKLYSRLPFTIERVIAILAQLKKVDDMQKMTVILCVDGLERLENDGSKQCDFYRVLSSICSFLNSSKAFSICVCSASMQYEALADSTLKHKYLIPPSLDGNRICVSWTRSARQVLDDIGGHGRALELLWEVMDRPNITEMTDPDYIVDEVLDGLKMRYGSVFNSGTFADPKTCKELVAAVISRRRYHLTDKVGQSPFTVETLRRLGFFHWTDERRLECAFIFIVLMVKKIPKEPREIDSFGDNLPRTRSTCEQFEHFVAFIRSLKSIAYCGTQVALSEFHTGARFGSVDGIDIIEPHSRTVVENIRKVEAKPDTYFTNRRGYVDISKMKTIHINERKGFAGDIVTRVELIEKGSYRCDEVIQCKLFSTTRKVGKEQYLKEREDAVSGDSDVFLLITSAEVADFDLPPRCGVISIVEFEQYFGSLASRQYRSLLKRQCFTC
ncbi:Crinkler (CRN), partial [Phytophthora megakarya]